MSRPKQIENNSVFSIREAAAACESGHREKARANKPLPVEVRELFLAVIYVVRPFRHVLGDLGLTSNEAWGSPGPMTSGRQRYKPR